MGNTYYVSADAGNNDGGHDGSQQKPWKTIQFGISRLGSGDTLIVKDGSYKENITISQKASAGNEITIRAENYLGAVIIGNWDAWKNPGFPGNDDLPPTASPPTQYSGGPGLIEITGSHVIVDGFEAHSHAHRGRFFNGAKNSVIRNCYVHHVFETGLKALSAENCIFEDCENGFTALRGKFRSAGIATNHPTVSSATDSDNVTFRRCIVHDGGGEGIGCGSCGKDITVENCIVYNVQTVHIYTDRSSGAIIRNNIVYTTSRRSPSGNESRGIIFRDEPAGDRNCSSSRKSKNVYVYNNLIVGFGRGIWVTAKANLDSYVVAYNTIVNCNKGIEIFAVSSDFDDIRLRSNSIFENNVIDCASSEVVSTEGIIWRNNNWRVTPPSMAEGQGDVVGEPRLKNRDADFTGGTLDMTNYRLTDASPAIDAAVDHRITLRDGSILGQNDIRGVPRDAVPDLGFFEHSVLIPDVEITRGDIIEQGVAIGLRAGLP